MTTSPSPRPVADAQTLDDLEVLRSARGPSLFELVDRTRTTGGRARLRERFLAPLSGADAIAGTQEALRFILRHPGAFEPFADDATARHVAAYADSGWETDDGPTPLLALRGAWLRQRGDARLEALAAGVERTLILARAAADFAARALALGPPPLLEALAREAGRHAAELAAALPRGGGALSPGAVLAADRELRPALRGAVHALLDRLHHLDALASMAAATAEQGWTFPEVIRGEGAVHVRAEGLYHPFLPHPVPNDAELGGGEGALMFVTGPNMAGKTTFLRSLGLAVYLGQLGMGVPARRLAFTPVEHLFAGIGVTDDVRAGCSYFRAEVLRVRAAAALLAEGRRVLALFDEMFRGTNVKDACDATLEVVRGFARATRAAFVLTSHLAELVPELERVPAVQLRCFDASMEAGGALRFTYRILPGASSQRLGMTILEREGVIRLLRSLPGPDPRP